MRVRINGYIVESGQKIAMADASHLIVITAYIENSPGVITFSTKDTVFHQAEVASMVPLGTSIDPLAHDHETVTIEIMDGNHTTLDKFEFTIDSSIEPLIDEEPDDWYESIRKRGMHIVLNKPISNDAGKQRRYWSGDVLFDVNDFPDASLRLCAAFDDIDIPEPYVRDTMIDRVYDHRKSIEWQE